MYLKLYSYFEDMAFAEKVDMIGFSIKLHIKEGDQK